MAPQGLLMPPGAEESTDMASRLQSPVEWGRIIRIEPATYTTSLKENGDKVYILFKDLQKWRLWAFLITQKPVNTLISWAQRHLSARLHMNYGSAEAILHSNIIGLSIGDPKSFKPQAVPQIERSLVSLRLYHFKEVTVDEVYLQEHSTHPTFTPPLQIRLLQSS